MKKEVPDTENFDEKSEKLFSKLQISWDVSKDEVWNDLSQEIKQAKVIKMQNKKPVYLWAIAASVILLLGLTALMRFYTQTLYSPAGMHLTAQLPDGSKVYLNADAQISYHPYWWKIKRTVNLKGEAFFEVKKGEKFSVQSAMGTTEVLGTSFNIYARDKRYEVTCVTGKVKVSDNKSGKSLQIKPGEKAELKTNGQLKLKENVNTDNVKAWISNRFVFTSVPIDDVFKEIERQYKVEIILPKEELNLLYSGSFEKSASVKEVLYFVSRPFGLNVYQQADRRFLISKQK